MATMSETENEVAGCQSETALSPSTSKQVDSDDPLSAGSQASTTRDVNFDESAIPKVDSDDPLSAGSQASTTRDMNFDESAISKVGFEEPLLRRQASTTRDVGLHGISKSKTLMPLHRKDVKEANLTVATPSAITEAVHQALSMKSPGSSKQQASSSCNGGTSVKYFPKIPKPAIFNNDPPEFEEENPAEHYAEESTEMTTSNQQSAVSSSNCQIFLSYCQKNKRNDGNVPEAVRDFLENQGYKVWIDSNPENHRLYDDIVTGIDNSQVFVACISKDYYESQMCRHEMLLAFQRSKEIIPLMLEEVTWLPKEDGISLVLVPYLYIKTYGTESRDKWSDKLLTRVKGLIGSSRESVNGSDSAEFQVENPAEYYAEESTLMTTSNQQSAVTCTQWQVFISYCHKNKTNDENVPEAARDVLETNGYKVWIDSDCARHRLYDDIVTGIDNSKVFVACISKDYYESKMCRREMVLAFQRGKKIIPLMLEEVNWLPEVDGISLALVRQSCIETYGTESRNKWSDKLLTRVKGLIRSRLES